MSNKIYKIAILSISFSIAGQLSHAVVAVPTVQPQSQITAQKLMQKQPSLIAKAAEKKHLFNEATQDELHMLNSMQTTPSQNFLAQQNQKFTRFIQALFS